MSGCRYRCLAPDGARCEHPVDHEGPHRNGLLIWHDPPVLFVGGKPYVPPVDPNGVIDWLAAAQGEIPSPTTEAN